MSMDLMQDYELGNTQAIDACKTIAQQVINIVKYIQNIGSSSNDNKDNNKKNSN